MSQLQTIKTFANFVEVLTQVQKDPKFLQEAADQAYTLGEQGEKRLKDAHKTIADARDFLAKHEDAKKELADIQANIEAERLTLVSAQQEHGVALEKHEANVLSLGQAVEAFKGKELEHKRSVSALDEQSKQVDLYHKSIIEREQALLLEEEKINARWEEVKAYEAKLKSHAAKLREQAASLAE